jgi:hypothetical protein
MFLAGPETLGPADPSTRFMIRLARDGPIRPGLFLFPREALAPLRKGMTPIAQRQWGNQIRYEKWTSDSFRFRSPSHFPFW